MEPRTIKSIVAFLSSMAREGSNLDKFDNKILLASSYLMHSKKKCVGVSGATPQEGQKGLSLRL